MGAGSIMIVLPFAYIPANNKHDFTCALAIGNSYVMADKSFPPCTYSGTLPLSLPIIAPISTKGSITRPMGRLARESSPFKMVLNFWPANKPQSSRIDVPELPKSSVSVGNDKPCIPTPWTVIHPFLGPSIITPIFLKADKVDKASSPSKKPVTSVTPSAIAPNIIARCEIDLSPGTRIVPISFPPG